MRQARGAKIIKRRWQGAVLVNFLDQNNSGTGSRRVNGLDSRFNKRIIIALPTQKNGAQFRIVLDLLTPVG